MIPNEGQVDTTGNIGMTEMLPKKLTASGLCDESSEGWSIYLANG